MRQTKSWTQDEESILRERYLLDGPTILSVQLERTRQSVMRKAWHMGITDGDAGHKSAHQIAQIRKIHEQGKHKSRLQSPEYHEIRKETVLKYNTKRRAERRLSGTCIRCTTPTLEYSTSYCLKHWAILSAGNTCKQYNDTFGSLLISKLEQQNYRCALTGDILIPSLNCSVDHIVPKSKGGAVDDPSNLRWVTVDANRAKGDLSDEEFLAFCKRAINHLSRDQTC